MLTILCRNGRAELTFGTVRAWIWAPLPRADAALADLPAGPHHPAEQRASDLMSSFHPIYTGVAKEVLLLVDDHFARGNLRDWASFTHTAAKLCEEHGRERLDAEIARNTFALHGGGAGG
jgi:hypothetical protein